MKFTLIILLNVTHDPKDNSETFNPDLPKFLNCIHLPNNIFLNFTFMAILIDD
jgi:hypothetical protein